MSDVQYFLPRTIRTPALGLFAGITVFVTLGRGAENY